MRGFSEDSKDRIRMIAESLIRQGEEMLGICEGDRVKKQKDRDEDYEDEDESPSKKKVGMMIAFVKGKKKK